MYHLSTPSLERFASLGADDVGLLWARNTVLMLIVIGGQHWWLHIRRTQGTDFKCDGADRCHTEPLRPRTQTSKSSAARGPFDLKRPLTDAPCAASAADIFSSVLPIAMA